MVEESPLDPSSGPPESVDRLLRRIGTHPSLPVGSASSRPALGPPSAVADERHEIREPSTDVVVTPARIYVTVELPGVSRETLEVTATERQLTIHAIAANGRVFHKEIELRHPTEPEAVAATYRNGVLDVTLPRKQGHPIRVKRGD